MQINPTPQYLAGLIDGDGCIGIHKRKANNRAGYDFRPSVSITMSKAKDLFEAIRAKYGGTIICYPSKMAGTPLYQYIVVNRKAVKLVKDVLPYLVIKRPQAEKVLEFEKYIGRGHLTDEAIKQQVRLYNEMAQLNKRPKQKITPLIVHPRPPKHRGKVYDIPEKLLRYLYWELGLDTHEIAYVINHSQWLVRMRMKEYSIPFRKRGGFKHIEKSRIPLPNRKVRVGREIISIKELRERYMSGKLRW